MTTPGDQVGPRDVAREIVRAARLLVVDPPAGRHRIARGISFIRAAVLLRGCERGALVSVMGPMRVVAEGKIRLGTRVQLIRGLFPIELVCRAGGELVIGALSLLSYGVSIEASHSVRIGERSILGSMVRIRDAGERGAAPVVIADDVWIAHGSIVEPGVTIGEGSVVSAGSVVLTDVPPFSLASGNPATSVPLRGARERAELRPPR